MHNRSRMSVNRNLPVLVMIISVPSSLNLSHNSLVSRRHSTGFRQSQLQRPLSCGLSGGLAPADALHFFPLDFFLGVLSSSHSAVALKSTASLTSSTSSTSISWSVILSSSSWQPADLSRSPHSVYSSIINIWIIHIVLIPVFILIFRIYE